MNDFSSTNLSPEEQEAVTNYAIARIRAAQQMPTESAVAEESRQIISNHRDFEHALDEAVRAKENPERHYARLAAEMRRYSRYKPSGGRGDSTAEGGRDARGMSL